MEKHISSFQKFFDKVFKQLPDWLSGHFWKLPKNEVKCNTRSFFMKQRESKDFFETPFKKIVSNFFVSIVKSILVAEFAFYLYQQ